jgi:sirohydrochlorin cobaltochelatase
MVCSHMNTKRRANMKTPQQVLAELKQQGHSWAVVQSLHLICGHEFARLVDAVKESVVRISMGLPLLTSPGDYRAVAAAILSCRPMEDGSATVLVGHGTDHPAWSAYPALAEILRSTDANIQIATVEGEPEMAKTVDAVVRSGAKKVHLMPLMLVAGVHLQEDIAGEEDSWKQAFEEVGLAVSVDVRGMGKHPGVVDVFIRHIRDALDMVLK